MDSYIFLIFCADRVASSGVLHLLFAAMSILNEMLTILLYL